MQLLTILSCWQGTACAHGWLAGGARIALLARRPPSRPLAVRASCIHTPHWQVALAAISVVICYADRSNISTAIIPMSEQYGWARDGQGLILSAFFLGYLLTQLLGGERACAAWMPLGKPCSCATRQPVHHLAVLAA